MGHRVSFSHLHRIPLETSTPLSPHLAHAESSVPGFLLGPMQPWAEDHLAEKLYSPGML